MWRLLLLSILWLAATPASADCNADLAEVVKRHVTAGPFRVVTTLAMKDGPSLSSSVDVVVPNRFFFHGIAFLGPNGPIADGPLIIGREGWVRDSAGWTKLPAEVKPGERNAFYNDLAERHDTAEERRCLGPVERDGRTLAAYAFRSKHWIGSWQVVWETVLHVDPAAGLPVVEDVVSSMPELPDQPKQRATLTYTYDPSITIEAPAQ